MTKYSTLVFLLITLVACNSSKEKNQNDITRDAMQSLELYKRDTLSNGNIRFRPHYSLIPVDTSIIHLSFITTIPETIPGARELYTYDTTQLTSKRYIFLTDLTEYAIVKNNGKDIYLMKQYEKCETLSDNTFRDVFLGNGYTIKFTHKKLKHRKGKTYEIGVLEIENAKHKTIINIHGGYEL